MGSGIASPGHLRGRPARANARVFVIILVAKKSRQKGLGQGLPNGCKPSADNRLVVLTSNTVKPLYVVPVCEYETTYYRWYK
jgi:hypothetical protein